MSVTVLDINFQTIRAAVDSIANEIKNTTAARRIPFGPGFQESTAVFVNQQTLADLVKFGETEPSDAAK